MTLDPIYYTFNPHAKRNRDAALHQLQADMRIAGGPFEGPHKRTNPCLSEYFILRNSGKNTGCPGCNLGFPYLNPLLGMRVASQAPSSCLHDHRGNAQATLQCAMLGGAMKITLS